MSLHNQAMSEAAIKQVIAYLNYDPACLKVEDSKGTNSSEPDGMYITNNEIVAIEHTTFDPKDLSGVNPVRHRQIYYDKLMAEVSSILMPLLKNISVGMNIELHPTLNYFPSDALAGKADIKRMAAWRKHALDIMYAEIFDWLHTVDFSVAGIKQSWTREHSIAQPDDWRLPPQVQNGALIEARNDSDFLSHMWHAYRRECQGRCSFLSEHLFYHVTLQPNASNYIWMNRKTIHSPPAPNLKEVNAAIIKKSEKIPKYMAFIETKFSRKGSAAWLVLDASDYNSHTQLQSYFGEPTITALDIDAAGFDKIFFVDCLHNVTLQLK